MWLIGTTYGTYDLTNKEIWPYGRIEIMGRMYNTVFFYWVSVQNCFFPF